MRTAWIMASLLVWPLPAFAQNISNLPPDRPTLLGGVEAVCTGVGLESRANPAWASYSLKVEIAGPAGAYLGQEEVTVWQGAKPLSTARCDEPWLLFRLPAGRYRVEAKVGEETVSSGAVVPASGQGRIVLRFKGGMP